MLSSLKTILAATAVAAGSAAAGEPAMNDLEIAHAAYTAGSLDIRYAHLALAVSEHPEVRAFAETMIRDHGAVNDAALALVRELGVTPEDNDLSRALVAGAAEKRAELMGLGGNAFDCAYAYICAYHPTMRGEVVVCE